MPQTKRRYVIKYEIIKDVHVTVGTDCKLVSAEELLAATGNRIQLSSMDPPTVPASLLCRVSCYIMMSEAECILC